MVGMCSFTAPTLGSSLSVFVRIKTYSSMRCFGMERPSSAARPIGCLYRRHLPRESAMFSRRQQITLSTLSVILAPFVIYDSAIHSKYFWCAFWIFIGIAHSLILYRELKGVRTNG
jgi:hypothetical protein